MPVEVAEATSEVLAKEARLRELLAEYGPMMVAYSGGVDSAFLSDTAYQVLGAQATIVLADSPSIPRSEVREAETLAHKRGWNFHTIRTEEFGNEDYLKNDGTRCYFCRNELFTKMEQYAEEQGSKVLAYGAIVDDLMDTTRLGAKAAKEHRVAAPLQEADLSKAEIRALSQRRGLPTAEKPSFACLSSRFPVGTRVTREDIEKVEKAEEILKNMGFSQYRARHHGDVCRIEVDPEDFPRLMDPEIREFLAKEIKAVGYRHAALDLMGYRTGITAAPSTSEASARH